ncbi:hypothetical protein [Euzebya pacifica]|nr:hypothetical protein [Euzebya pacifica]
MTVRPLLVAASRAEGSDHWRLRHGRSCTAAVCADRQLEMERRRRAEQRGDAAPVPTDDEALLDDVAAGMVAGTIDWYDVADRFGRSLGWVRDSWEPLLMTRWVVLEEQRAPSGRHGTVHGYVKDGCRGPGCAAAMKDDSRRRRRAVAYGRPALVPVGPIGEHLDDLAAAGVGMPTVSRQAGVALSTVQSIRSRSRPMVQATTADRLLGVSASMAATVDSSDTRAVIAELLLRGWTKAGIARQVVSPGATVLHIGVRPRTSRANHDAVAALLDRPWPGTPSLPAPMWPDDRVVSSESAKALLLLLAEAGVNPRRAAARIGVDADALVAMGERTTLGVIGRLRRLAAAPHQPIVRPRAA